MSESLLQTGYFINKSQQENGRTGSGYWEPHTSSIDFCETNYLHTTTIVEPHNVWSSLLGLTLVGILGIYYGNPTRETRFGLIYFILAMIGIGSACLHASLHWAFQSSDELPMIYLIVGGVYAVLEVDSPMGEPRYPSVAKYLVMLSCVNTAIYYRFQHLYIIFIATFSAMLVLIMYHHIQIAWRLYTENRDDDDDEMRKRSKRSRRSSSHYKNNAISLRFYIWHYIAFLFVALPIWCLDQFHCGLLLPLYNNLPLMAKGMTLHVVWHILSGIATHFFVQFLVACRANTLGMACGTRCVLGIFPVVVVMPRDDGDLKRE
mmetsp:Transcript_14228/g.30394  ORF Transcript_14228/g.30394 Transcript_14228/m.30394 type:complete len:319 (+) Transcript_14228:130-1086(+)